MPTVLLSDYLEPENVFWHLPGEDKHAVLAALAERVAEREASVPAKTVLDLTEERESIQSTGIGQGLALPHAVVPGLLRTTLYVGRADPALDFDALDGQPVDLIFLLLSPPEGIRQHLRLVARLARLAGQTDLLDRLRQAAVAREAYDILLDEDSRHVY